MSVLCVATVLWVLYIWRDDSQRDPEDILVGCAVGSVMVSLAMRAAVWLVVRAYAALI